VFFFFFVDVSLHSRVFYFHMASWSINIYSSYFHDDRVLFIIDLEYDAYEKTVQTRFRSCA